jgi:hypothetical protein
LSGIGLGVLKGVQVAGKTAKIANKTRKIADLTKVASRLGKGDEALALVKELDIIGSKFKTVGELEKALKTAKETGSMEAALKNITDVDDLLKLESLDKVAPELKKIAAHFDDVDDITHITNELKANRILKGKDMEKLEKLQGIAPKSGIDRAVVLGKLEDGLAIVKKVDPNAKTVTTAIKTIESNYNKAQKITKELNDMAIKAKELENFSKTAQKVAKISNDRPVIQGAK